jgi:hypothetical protein
MIEATMRGKKIDLARIELQVKLIPCELKELSPADRIGSGLAKRMTATGRRTAPQSVW